MWLWTDKCQYVIMDWQKHPASGKEGFWFTEVKNRENVWQRFWGQKKVRLGGDSSIMRVRFRAVPLCTCSFQVSHFAHIYQSYLISLVFKLSNEAITEIKFDVAQISEIPKQTTFFCSLHSKCSRTKNFFQHSGQA